MDFHRVIAFVPSTAILALLAAAAAPAGGRPGRSAVANPPESPLEFVRQMVHNEIQVQNGKPIYWRYLEIDKTNGVEKVFDVYQTKAGTMKLLLAVNGKPLSAALRQKQHARLENILNHPSQAQAAARARNQDAGNERKMLALLPHAFHFQYDGRVGRLIRLRFRPDPRFDPPTHEAKVFHHMKGHLLVDPHQMRLAEMDGRLTSEVKFWWGLLGNLDSGGTFLVRQSDIQGNNWRMTRLKVNMKGKALFFKTIGVQQNQRFEDFHENPPDMTLRQAIDQLEQATLPDQGTKR
ncbi:MAG TPA: hypothetical protein VNJ12_13645 [Candidatus Dormibacteraeota bacterium]|nr:hypothetical protein [Candidatus Dormibacteraeota bacterium]